MYFGFWGKYLNHNWYGMMIISLAFELTFDSHHQISNAVHLDSYLCALELESGQFTAPFHLLEFPRSW